MNIIIMSKFDFKQIQLGSFYIQTLQVHSVSQTNCLGKLDWEKHCEIDSVDINMLISELNNCICKILRIKKTM